MTRIEASRTWPSPARRYDLRPGQPLGNCETRGSVVRASALTFFRDVTVRRLGFERIEELFRTITDGNLDTPRRRDGPAS